MSLLECLSSASVETSALPRPQFAIGDRVAEDWESDDARGVHHAGTDFGEIVGVRWMPDDRDWGYFVHWLSSTDETYDCEHYEAEPINESNLRLV